MDLSVIDSYYQSIERTRTRNVPKVVIKSLVTQEDAQQYQVCQNESNDSGYHLSLPTMPVSVTYLYCISHCK